MTGVADIPSTCSTSSIADTLFLLELVAGIDSMSSQYLHLSINLHLGPNLHGTPLLKFQLVRFVPSNLHRVTVVFVDGLTTSRIMEPPSILIILFGYGVSHGQVPHLIIGDSPTPLGIKCHQMFKCNVIIIDIVPRIGRSCSINHCYILPNFLRSMGICTTIYCCIALKACSHLLNLPILLSVELALRKCLHHAEPIPNGSLLRIYQFYLLVTVFQVLQIPLFQFCESN